MPLAAAAFLARRLTAWPPHEDETLALFVGRDSLGELFDIVLGERGGAPLHFLARLGRRAPRARARGLRLVSAAFAVASLPRGRAARGRLAGRRRRCSRPRSSPPSWVLLFHGIYGRMYSLFLFTSALSYLALLARSTAAAGGAGRSGRVAILAAVATHPYGALVLASQAVYVLLGAPRPAARGGLGVRRASRVLGIPFWLTDLVLAGRFDVGRRRRRREARRAAVVARLPRADGRGLHGRPRCSRPCSSLARGRARACSRARRALLAALRARSCRRAAFLVAALGSRRRPSRAT